MLAQRTADAAVHEAREEAARLMADARAEREAAQVELTEVRQRIADAAEDEGRTVRGHFEGQRAALQADVEALEAHLGRERERLRIYFADQLRRVEEGEPGMATRPDMTGPETAPTPAPAEAHLTTEHESGQADTDHESASPSIEASAAPPTGAPDDDPFLAELRRAVDDEQPLGPRDDAAASVDDDAERDEFDLFAKGEDDQGRFGSRLRRRR